MFMCTGGASSLCHVFVYSLPRHTISNLNIGAEPQPHSTVLESTQNGFFISFFPFFFSCSYLLRIEESACVHSVYAFSESQFYLHIPSSTPPSWADSFVLSTSFTQLYQFVDDKFQR